MAWSDARLIPSGLPSCPSSRNHSTSSNDITTAPKKSRVAICFFTVFGTKDLVEKCRKDEYLGHSELSEGPELATDGRKFLYIANQARNRTLQVCASALRIYADNNCGKPWAGDPLLSLS